MKPKRCALYTRKSTEEGLDQAFNSLDAQHEACAAYVKSQASEGWRAVKDRYDDGGFSGGSMERPALQRMLADIAAGKIDIVVVYKIDRLTRSLADFARMVELFDRHQVSFVSVTQAFNTTSSMGRLTLNVLLSFAQFEREVTGERIRDKIAASKARGMWMGGTLPLGYDPAVDGSRALVVNEAEAEIVRMIFRTYLELRSVHSLERWLDERDIRSKRRVTKIGKILGGHPLSRGALFHLLRNRTYLGMIVHRDKAHPGMHPAVIGTDTFEAVQQQLDANVRRHAQSRNRVARAPLAGRIFDAEGEPMSPATAYGKTGKLYRYYVSAPLQQGRPRPGNVDDNVRRVAAAAFEARLSEMLERLTNGRQSEPLSLPSRIEVHVDHVEMLMPIRHLDTIRRRLTKEERADPDYADPGRLRLTLPICVRTRGGPTSVVCGRDSALRPDPTLIKALRTAHAMVEADPSGMPIMRSAPDSLWRRRLVRLAFLAPNLQQAILSGRQPLGLTLARLMEAEIPGSWAEQARRFGAPSPIPSAHGRTN